MKTSVHGTVSLAAVLLAGALGGCEKSTSGDVRLDSPGAGAGNSATGATGGTAGSPGVSGGDTTGTGVGNSTAATPGSSGSGAAATPSPNPDAAGGGGAGKPDEKTKPVDKATPPPY
jgi:hypothetical protein